MADWQEWFTSCFMSLVFAYMVTKLISIVHSFRRENLRLEREHEESSDSAEVMEERSPEFAHGANVEHLDVTQPPASVRDTLEFALSQGERGSDNVDTPDIPQTIPSEGLFNEGIDVPHAHTEDAFGTDAPPPFGGMQNAASLEGGSDKEESLLSDEEDWEGVDGSALDKAFGKAAAFLEKLVLDPSFKISNDRKLQFYGLYKQATEGPCSSPQPPAYRVSTRAKWNAWKSLRDVSPDEAMQRYITQLSELYPDWNQANKDEELVGSSKKAPRMGPVFSTMLSDANEQDGLEIIHKYAKEGDLKGLEALLQSNTSVDQKDGDNRTALHWAADQGHLDIVKLLISRGAEINAKDSDGQTALHYASTCEWDEVAAFLLENGADPSLVDNEGCTPYEHSASPYKNSGGQDIK